MEPDRQQRLDAVAEIFVRLESEFGLPPEDGITRWAMESAWGAEPSGHANYFGIKKADRNPMCCVVATHEVINGKRIAKDLEFSDYPDIEASCHDYAWLITHGAPYHDAWQQYQKDRNVQGLEFHIARTYATDPNYWSLAQHIAAQSNVADAINRARGGAS